MLILNDIVPTIAVIGLPGSGKSTFVNSIVSKKIVKTGVCSTTLSSTFIGLFYDEKFNCSSVKSEKLMSDDNFEFNLIDLPSIGNVLNEEKKFDKLIHDTVIKADIILWTTPSGTGFLTKYEEEKFLDIVKVLNNDTLKTGVLHQIGIIVTKCNDFFKKKRR